MPWTCPQCGGETDLGFNICWTCQAPRPGSEPAQVQGAPDILITTTSSLETHEISSYLGPVFGETIFGANIFRDFFASITDIVGGRSAQYESVLNRGRSTALAEMADHAKRLGGNAVIGTRFDYSPLADTMLMICCTGTAVVVEPKNES